MLRLSNFGSGGDSSADQYSHKNKESLQCGLVTCSGVMTAAWTGSLQRTIHPAAGDAGCYSAHRRCKLCVRTPESQDRASHYHCLRNKTNSWVWIHRSYLQGSHADNLIGVIEEIGQNVKNGGFREDKFLWRIKETHYWIWYSSC